MILIWSVVVLLVILGGWLWWQGLPAQVVRNAHLDSLPELRERLERPIENDEGRSWTNEATYEIWYLIDDTWGGYPNEVESDYEDGGIYNLSAEHLRTSELDKYISHGSHGSGWQLGHSYEDAQIYIELVDYDQLSERLQESFKQRYPDKEYSIE
jgi:hypothetical protein